MGVLSATKPCTFIPDSTNLFRKFYPCIAANTYFSGKNFSLTISCFIGGFHRCQKFKYANAIMIASVFKHLPRSEEAVHTCSLKKLFWSISYNSQKKPVQESLFVWTIFFHCFISSLPSYCFKTLFIHSRSTFLFLLH